MLNKIEKNNKKNKHYSLDLHNEQNENNKEL